MARLVPPDWLARISRLPPSGGPSGADWARAAERLVQDMLVRFDVEVTGAALTGRTSVVLPVDRAGEPLALKVVWPHREAAGEPLALRHWAGAGAVRLVAADPAHGALLLERLASDQDLNTVDVEQACDVVGRLLARLHVPAPPSLPTLREYLDEHLPRMTERADLPRRLVARVSGLATELLERPDSGASLLHTDLHFGNVLAPLPGQERGEPWLAIDPKPLAGHPGFELQPVLRNRTAELGTGAAFRWGVRRRVELVCTAAGLDEDLARAWTIVHTGLQCLWAAEDSDKAALSLHIAILKALED